MASNTSTAPTSTNNVNSETKTNASNQKPSESKTNQKPSAPKTLATKHFMATTPDVENARRELYRLGIKTSYNSSVMIFSTMHNSKTNMNNAYIQECNGLILEQGSWRPLVVPPRTLRCTISTEESNCFLHQGLYHIYRAEDGTCFNMYYYDDHWVISTNKGHTMNDMKWDTQTYQAIISECLASIGLSWDTFTASLDKNTSYSFGFKHPSFHKFYEGGDKPLYKIWFIQSVVVDAAHPRYLWASDQSPIAIIPPQELITEPVGNLRELYKLAGSALDNFCENKSICYGFILRSANAQVTKSHSDLFIESALMRTIRKFWYENHINEACHRNGWNKEYAIAFNCYLDTENYEVFRLMFPQYIELMGTFNLIISTIVNEMVAQTKDTTGSTLQPIQFAAEQFCLMYKSSIKYDTRNSSEEQLRKIYYEFVCHPSSLELLMSLPANIVDIINESATPSVIAPTNAEAGGVSQ